MHDGDMPISIPHRTPRGRAVFAGAEPLRCVLGGLLGAALVACAPSPGDAPSPRDAARNGPPAPTAVGIALPATRDTSRASGEAAASPATRSNERRPDAPSSLATPDAATVPPSAPSANGPEASRPADPPRVLPSSGTPDAATRLVATYFDALARHRDAEAALAWRDDAQAAAFLHRYIALGRPRVALDVPGPIEGAAGSLYVTVPVRFAATRVPGDSRERHGEVVLRRVNDVPGSTDAQRRWHIERIDIAMTPK